MTFCILIKDAIASKPMLRLPILSFLLRYKPMHHTRLQELWWCKKGTLVFRAVVHFPFGVQSHCSFQFGVQSHIFISAFKDAFSIWHSESLFVSSSAFFVIIHFFGLAFRAASSFWHSKLHLHIGIQSRCLSLVRHLEPFFVWCSQLHFSVQHSEPHLHLDVQSHIFILAFRAIVCLQFDIQSHCSFFIWHLELLFILVRRSEPHLQFSVQSHIFISTFKAAFSVWHLELQFHFGVQSHYLFLVQHSQPSYLFSVWRSELHLHFGVQSYIFILEFKATSSFWRSESLFVFSSTSRAIFHLVFRVAFSVWISEPYLHLGVQSHIFILDFRAIVCLQFDNQSHFPFGVQSHCSFQFGV